jgi:hypothetical protein
VNCFGSAVDAGSIRDDDIGPHGPSASSFSSPFIGRRNDISDRVKLVLQILVLLLELVDFVQQVLLYMLNPLGRSHFFHTG